MAMLGVWPVHVAQAGPVGLLTQVTLTAAHATRRTWLYHTCSQLAAGCLLFAVQATPSGGLLSA